MSVNIRYLFALLIMCFGVLTTAAQNDVRDPLDAIIGLSVHPTLPHYATVKSGGTVEIFNYETATLEETYTIKIPFQSSDTAGVFGFNIQAIEYAPDGGKLAISVVHSASSGLIYMIDLTTKQIELAHNASYLHRINDMSWNPDGTKIVLALQSGTIDQIILSSIEILDVTTGEIEVTLVERDGINNETASSVDWWRSGVIAYAQWKKLTIWDAVTVDEMSIEVENEILDIAWSPQGDRIAMSSLDGTIQIWKVAANDITLLDAFSPVTPNFFSRTMTWIDDSILAVNRWTNIEIWNAAEPDCIQLIETEHFIFGIGVLRGGQILYAGPNEVVAVDLSTRGHCLINNS